MDTENDDMIIIDGSFGEGGGAILRTSVPLGILMQKPLEVINIRKNRKKPGLRQQHLQGLHALSVITGSQIDGLEQGSTRIRVIPGSRVAPSSTVTLKTAGSIALLLQVLQNFACGLGSSWVHDVYKNFHGSFTVHVKGGGTHGKWAPTMEFIEELLVPLLAEIGVDIKITINKYGFYPKGGGDTSFEFTIKQKPRTRRIEFKEEPNVTDARVHAVISRGLSNGRVAERMIKEIERLQKKEMPHLEIDSHIQYVDSLSFGGGLQLVSYKQNEVAIGGGSLAEKGVSSERVARRAWSEFTRQARVNVNLDLHLSDQVLIPFVLNGVSTRFSVLEHTRHAFTNQWVLEQFGFKGLVHVIEEDSRVVYTLRSRME